jgi:3-oxoacyl-[acyl-carrier-protein] synthase II
MKAEVAITGTGLISALGDQPAEVHRARCEKRSAVRMLEFSGRDAKMLGASLTDFDGRKYLGDGNLRPLNHVGQLAISASQGALENAGISREERDAHEMDLALGTMFCSAHTITQFDRKAQISGPKYAMPLEFANTVINAASGQTAIWHNLRGTTMTISAGTLSGLRALEYAARRIALGWSDQFLVGGVDEHCFETSWAFLQSGHASDGSEEVSVSPFGKSRRGFAPGEGAAFLVLESGASARRRGSPVLGTVLGWSSGYSPAHESEAVRSATAYEAIAAALSMADCEAARIGYVSCSANGSIKGDEIEAHVLREVLGDRLGKVPIAVPAESFGNALAPSGIFQAIEALETARQGMLPPFCGARNGDLGAIDLGLSPEPTECAFDRALVFSCGLDGSVSAVVLGIID